MNDDISGDAGGATSSAFPSGSPRIPEDTVFYSLYPDEVLPLPSLHSLHLHIIADLVPSFVPSDYIWHRDPFHLSPSPSPPLPHLRGLSRFADALEDEWLIAALLFHISRSLPNLSISLHDSDGQFLLIEAALHLPRWLRPQSSLNRVFIRGGRLHIIPPSSYPISEPLSLPSALSILRSAGSQTLAPDGVQSAINRRIAAYPARALENLHTARAVVPLAVAQVLRHEACLISLAVEAFYDRDIDSMKHAMRMERFLGEGEGREMVRVGVRMTRAMYGQLMMQRFQAPRCYPMPGVGEAGSEGYREAELGMKITCGFEMMYQDRRMAGEDGGRGGGAWEVFLKSLERSGVFEGLLPGSKEYKRIVEGAMEYYKKSEAYSRTRDMMNAPVRRIDEILALPHSADDFNMCELPPSDDDSWLYGGEDELNSALLERQKEMEAFEKRKNKNSGKQKSDSNSAPFSGDFNFKEVAESMQAFVQKLSSFEGAETPKERNSNGVELDVSQFIKDMESVIGPVGQKESIHDADIEEDSSSEMDFDESDYGSDIDEPCEGDDDATDNFMESYSDALREELNSTTLKKSFIRASQQPGNNDEGTSNVSENVDNELTPVDVDVNLVKSFLDSFSSQEGLPGPASNLLGLMGLNLPHGANNK